MNIRVAIAISLFIHTVLIALVMNLNSLLIDHSKKPLTLIVQMNQAQAPSAATIEPQKITEEMASQEVPTKKLQTETHTKGHSMRQQHQMIRDPSAEKINESNISKTTSLNTKNLNSDEHIIEKSAEDFPSSVLITSSIENRTQLEKDAMLVEKIAETSNPVHEKSSVTISASYAKNNQKPEYPTRSRRLNEQGTVVLQVLVLENGTAGKVEVKNSSGFPLLDEAAKNAVIQWHFMPAKIDGQPISESYSLSIPFVLN